MKRRFQFQFPFSLFRNLGIGAIGICTTIAVILLSGCHLGLARVTESPLSYSEQKQAILEVAPIGTPRNEAMNKLSEAGIEGSYGVSESIFYCDTWTREDGAKWHINVSLYFDKSNKLYEARPAQSMTSVISADDDVNNQKTTNQSNTTSSPAARTSSAAMNSGSQKTSGTKRSSGRNGRRTPFISTEEFQ